MRRTRGALEAARRENLRTDMQAQPGEFNRAAEPIASIFRSVCSYPELSDAGMGADPERLTDGGRDPALPGAPRPPLWPVRRRLKLARSREGHQTSPAGA
jgi:hypothetical protein